MINEKVYLATFVLLKMKSITAVLLYFIALFTTTKIHFTKVFTFIYHFEFRYGITNHIDIPCQSE